MSAQISEIFIADGIEFEMHSDPLDRKLKRHRIRARDYVETYSTAGYRCYVGVWQIIEGRLYLTDLHLINGYGIAPLPEALRAKLLAATRRRKFPILANWYTGPVSIATGDLLCPIHIYWESRFARRRIVHVRRGRVVRDREVDTQKMLERCLRRDPELMAKFKEMVEPEVLARLDFTRPAHEQRTGCRARSCCFQIRSKELASWPLWLRFRPRRDAARKLQLRIGEFLRPQGEIFEGDFVSAMRPPTQKSTEFKHIGTNHRFLPMCENVVLKRNQSTLPRFQFDSLPTNQDRYGIFSIYYKCIPAENNTSHRQLFRSE